MKKDEFLTLLYNEMIRLGATPETAEHHTRAIHDAFSHEDIARVERIKHPDEVYKLAQAIVGAKPESDAVQSNPADTETPETASADDAAEAEAEPTEEIIDDDTVPYDGEALDDDSDMKVYVGGDAANNLPVAADVDEDTFYEEMIRDDEEDGFITHVSPRGKQTFWIIFTCSLPLVLIFFVLYFGVFAALFAALASLIVLLIAGLIGGTAIGAAVAFVCIVYGISQLITVASSAPGVYEIGLGISVGGGVMMFGILIYNLAIRVVPKLFRFLGNLFRFCTGKLRELFHRAKEACYKL